jgi:hypothetical protein
MGQRWTRFLDSRTSMVIKQPQGYAAITVFLSFVSALQLGDFFASFRRTAHIVFLASPRLCSLCSSWLAAPIF